MSADKLILKANLPRTRDLSFVGRFPHNFGFDDRYFHYLLEQKDLWGDKLFYVDESQFSQWAHQGKHRVREVPAVSAFPDMQLEPLLAEQFQKLFGTKEIDITFVKGSNSAHHAMAHGDTVPLHALTDRTALAVNAGGTITSMKWLPYAKTATLAVLVIGGTQSLAELVANPALSVFPKKKVDSLVKSAIQLWKYDTASNKLTLSQVLDTTAFGCTSDLQWLPLRPSEDTLGVLSGAFTDGKLHFFKITDTASYTTVVRPSWTISVRDERSGNDIVPITAFDFLAGPKVVVGTLDGAIAEFVLPLHNHADLDTPSFVEYVCDSCITSLCVADVMKSQVILVNTATTQGFAIIYEQIRQGRVENNYTISTLSPTFHRGYRIFIYPDSAESIGYSFVRHPQQKHSLLLKTELITAFHTSEYLNHPFAVVGNACGDVYVLNVGRKIFGVPKAHNKLLVPLKLWSLRAEGNKLTLVADYVPSVPDKNDVMYTFTPPEIAVSATAWNETFDGSSLYAFGTYSGLLVVERMDPGA